MDTSGIHLWLVLWKAYDACQRRAYESIENLGMCYSDFAVLECLLNKGPMPVNSIGQKVSLTSGSITTAVDRLEARRLVARTNSSTDRRAKFVSLTKEGKRLIEQAFKKHRLDMESIAESLDLKERQLLLKLIKKFGLAAASKTLS